MKSPFLLLALLAVSTSVAFSTPAPRPDAKSGLAWDAITHDYHARVGEATKRFTFEVSNPSARDIVVESVTPSCGCTVVDLPPLPWTLRAGERGRLDATMDWTGRFGDFAKTIAVKTSAGPQTLTLKITIPPPENPVQLPLARARNLTIAAGDRQAVFKHDCARCHVAPAVEKTGASLYAAACGICHDAAVRATMVPDLRALPQRGDREFWRQRVTHGKPGSLMPAFSQREGGPLTDPQIESLVSYLAETFSRPAGALPEAPKTHAGNSSL